MQSVLVSVGVVVALGACSATPAPLTVSRPAVVVAEAGAEPREVFGYDIGAPATRLEVRMTAQHALGFRSGSRVSTSEDEKATVVFQLELGTVERRALATTLQLTVADVRVDRAAPKQRALIERTLAAERKTLRLRVTDAGEVTPSEDGERISDLVRELFVVFPPTPIGSGARWRATFQYRSDEVRWQRVVDYTLREITDAALVVEASVAMTAGEQVLSIEPNREVRLTSAFSTGTSTITVPRHGIITRATSRVATELAVIVVDHRARVGAVMRTEREVTVAAP